MSKRTPRRWAHLPSRRRAPWPWSCCPRHRATSLRQSMLKRPSPRPRGCTMVPHTWLRKTRNLVPRTRCNLNRPANSQQRPPRTKWPFETEGRSSYRQAKRSPAGTGFDTVSSCPRGKKIPLGKGKSCLTPARQCSSSLRGTPIAACPRWWPRGSRSPPGRRLQWATCCLLPGSSLPGRRGTR